MPKGTIRNPGSKKPMISVRTLIGKQLPLRSKAELEARFKNMLHEGLIETKPEYRKNRAGARDVRAEPGKGPMARVNENPVKALKRRLANKVK